MNSGGTNMKVGVIGAGTMGHKEGSNIKGFATVVFGDSFKITNIAILENKDKGELFVSMPRYRSNERLSLIHI